MSDKNIPIITLDGPSGTGKGTVCHMLAKHLGWHILDSGAIYRVLALAAQKHHTASDNITQLVQLARTLDLRFSTDAVGTHTFLDNEEVSNQIRSEQCGQNASRIAAIPEVREALIARQRAFAQPPGLVTDGRDMGTMIFPDALVKIYLHADAQERARRRYLQLHASGKDVSLAQVVEELAKRDTRDTARAYAPLMAAKDAVKIDTTELSVEQGFSTVLKIVDDRLQKRQLV